MRKIKGFTLLELIIVLIILGILVSIGIVNYTATIEHRKGEVCINNMRTIFAAWRIYNMKNDPDYDPNLLFRNINIINTNLGTVLDEKNFGPNTLNGNFGFHMDYTTTPRYRLDTFRQTGRYIGRRIICFYFPDGEVGTGLYYNWDGTWPWLPPDE